MATTFTRTALATALLLALPACFDDVFDDGADDATDTTGEPPPPPPPQEGFRVYPQYLLQDVPATVTIERDALPEPCLLDDDPEGGYLCDATGLPAGPVTLTVRRDGFDPALRTPELQAEAIVPLTVHLAPAGGPEGSWSACVIPGTFETCGDVCTNEMRTCAPASCATDDEQWPLASYQTFFDAECAAVPLEGLAASCDEPLPNDADLEIGSLRCCCVD